MNLIIGLGNPGREYESTRHNIGFMVVEKLAKELSFSAIVWSQENKWKAQIAKIGDIMLVKPQTFMNNSGHAVKPMLDYHKLKPDSIWIIHDDIDLPLGKIRIRDHGSSGGHNGVESIIKSIGSDNFVRFRLGIGRGKESISNKTDKSFRHKNVVTYVLSRFRRREAGSLKHLVKNGTEVVRIALNEGIDKAMNRYN
ncbi:aminoacyl-tRNA hydrolase [Patescibacteria group bacterium]